MQWNKLKDAISCVAGQYEFTIEKQLLSKLIVALRSTGAPPVTPTAAWLKAATLTANYIVGGNLVPLVSASLYDLAMLTDLKGGYGRDWTDTDLSDTNIVHPFGLDLRGDGTLQCTLNFPTTAANCTFSVYALNDGSMPPTLRYRSLTTSGTAAYEKALAVFARDETGTTISMKVGDDFDKDIDYLMGKVLFADEAKIEQETIFAKLLSEQEPKKVIFRASAAVTLFSVEVP